MSLFLSYSRDDADRVRPIVSALEADGHDVWVDTDDVRGSERWRTAIAEAIGRADAVLLMVSPHSMASASVEREITVASETAKRIVPVVIAEAQIPVAMQYELAGVQRVSFVGRDFDHAMGDLRRALGQPAGDGPRHDEPDVHHRRWAVLAAVGGLVAVAVWGWLAAQDDDRPDPSTSECPEELSAGFCESFDGAEVDPARWSVFENDGAATVSAGTLALRSDGGSFPFMSTSANPFHVSGGFRLTVGFRFTQAGEFGAGMSAQQGTPANGRPVEPDELPIAKVWQDVASGWVVESECGRLPMTPDTSSHTVEFEFERSGQVTVWVDGVERDRCEGTRRPDTLWLGNPTAPLDECACRWTSVSFDLVRIDVEP